MYEVIINGRDDGDFDQIARDIDISLEDERWWQDIKRLRRPDDLSTSQELAKTMDILEVVTNWPIASFQHGRQESRPKRFAALQKLLRKNKHRTSLGDLSDAGATVGMRSQRLPANLLAPSDSDSQGSLRGGDKDDADSDADDEAVASDSEPGVSGSNFDEYDVDAFTDESDSEGRPSMIRRTKTTPIASTFSKKLDLRRAIWKSPLKEGTFKVGVPTESSVSTVRPHPNASASDTAIFRTKEARKSQSMASTSSQVSSSSRARSAMNPPSLGKGSLPKFTSSPVPRSAVAEEEGAGPSIMFVDTPSPNPTKKKDPIATMPSLTQHGLADITSSSSASADNSPLSSTTALSQDPTRPVASGFPAQQAIPLSFNDLPCRAQHLILNELIRKHSDDTAVVFTTLPSPVEGSCESEAESVKYISDLEVLCQGLPPILLIHSNSMTVTMNL